MSHNNGASGYKTALDEFIMKKHSSREAILSVDRKWSWQNVFSHGTLFYSFLLTSNFVHRNCTDRVFKIALEFKNSSIGNTYYIKSEDSWLFLSGDCFLER